MLFRSYDLCIHVTKGEKTKLLVRPLMHIYLDIHVTRGEKSEFPFQPLNSICI